MSRVSDEAAQVMRHDLGDFLRFALQRLGVQVKELAHWWDCDAAYASRVLSGEKPLTEARVALLPRHVQIAMLQEWGTALDQLVGSRAAAIGALQAGLHLLALDAVPMRMAHATVPEPATAAEPKRRQR